MKKIVNVSNNRKSSATYLNDADNLHFLGLTKYLQKNSAEAISYILKALNINDENPTFHYNLGVIYKSINQLERALHHQDAALNLDSNNIHYMNEIALICVELNDLKKAQSYLHQALLLNSKDAVTNSNYAYLLRQQNKPNEAIVYAKKALTLNPSLSTAYMNIGQALVMGNKIKEGISSIERSFEYGDNHRLSSQQSVLLYLMYTDYSPKKIFLRHQVFCKNYLTSPKQHPNKKIKKNKKKLNIGFVSSDFRLHSVFYFIIALFENYDNEYFMFFCYSGVTQPDWATDRIKNRVDFWRDILNKNTLEIVKQIETDEIDILIDLSGHTKGNFLNVFTHKPAPIQMTFLGYPFSTGLNCIDYKIVDEYTDPMGKTEAIYSEKLLKLEPSFLCYSNSNEIHITETTLERRNSFITFGSFNKFSKLSPKILKIWAEILTSVKNSRLVLKNNQPISDLLYENILSTFISHGINTNRIFLKNPTADTEAHMCQYKDIDICLDTYPYNGTTTTLEALWMGVPVITLTGEDHRSRVGNSILCTISHEELIASSAQEYMNISIALANNIQSIMDYRQTLRPTLKSSALMNGEKYSRKFEDLLKSAWNRYKEI